MQSLRMDRTMGYSVLAFTFHYNNTIKSMCKISFEPNPLPFPALEMEMPIPGMPSLKVVETLQPYLSAKGGDFAAPDVTVEAIHS
jgi:hypothetical protein